MAYGRKIDNEERVKIERLEHEWNLTIAIRGDAPRWYWKFRVCQNIKK